MCSGSEAGSYVRLVDCWITQLKAHGPSRTCNESKEEEAEATVRVFVANLLLSSLTMSDPKVYEPEQDQLFPVHSRT